MVPRQLETTGVTTSERRVHEALAKSSLPGTGLHSLNLPEHQYKLMAELDFVLALDSAVLVIEVKGGQVSCSDGLWTYSDRSGHFRQSEEGPFNQAKSGMYALRDRLRDRLGPRDLETVAFGYLVVTPDVDLPQLFEWPEDAYCGRTRFIKDFDGAVRRAARYWVDKHRVAASLSAEQRTRLVQQLRPDFDRSPLLDARARALDLAFVRLTDEQYLRLDLVSEAERILCTGGAGTGKTLLAIEAARREALTGKSVLFTCRSPLLASRVASELSGTAVSVRSYAELPSAPPWDVLVVDEAQDYMNFRSLDLLEGLVVGGLARGRWMMFMDPNRQALLYGDFDNEALAFVRSIGPVPASLKFNCRNTREIAFQTRAFTGADTGVRSAGSGPEVEFAMVEDEDGEAARLEKHLRHLRSEEVPPDDIAIVSMRGDLDSTAARLTASWRAGRVRELTASNVNDRRSGQVSWSSAVDFKGLESLFVCVIDIDELDSESQIDLLYVAMSRAKAGLWVAAQNDLKARFEELYRLHGKAALEALREIDQ